MYTGLLHGHSGLRWIVLLLLVITIIKAFIGWFGNQKYTGLDNKLALFSLISVHLQLVIGLILLFVSPTIQAAMQDMGTAMKDSAVRLRLIEHPLMMLIGIILITIGKSRTKRIVDGVKKHKNIAFLYTIGLVLILSRIPAW